MLVANFIPVNISKPFLLHDFRNGLEAHNWVFFEHIGDEAFHALTHKRLVKERLMSHDVLKHLLVILVEKGRQARQHLIQENAEAIDIYPSVMSFHRLQHLWTQILR